MTTAAGPSQDAPWRAVIVMGVSGVGKSTVAVALAAALGWDFVEGDDLHPAANIAAMAAGRALTDDDRWPWLHRIGDWLDAARGDGRSAVVTCSALKRAYRDVLREGRPGVAFCELDAPADLIGARMRVRRGHFMPASLLPSQLATLEPLGPDEPGIRIDVGGSPEQVVARAVAGLFPTVMPT